MGNKQNFLINLAVGFTGTFIIIAIALIGISPLILTAATGNPTWIYGFIISIPLSFGIGHAIQEWAKKR